MIEGIKVFADGAELDKMVASYKAGEVSGFTTNPSLMKKPVSLIITNLLKPL